MGFTNFYLYFIRCFSKTAAPLTLILKITRILGLFTLIALKTNNNEIVENDSCNKVDEIDKKLFKFKISKNNKCKNLMYVLSIEATKEPIFLAINAKKDFKPLKQAFLKALTL